MRGKKPIEDYEVEPQADYAVQRHQLGSPVGKDQNMRAPVPEQNSWHPALL